MDSEMAWDASITDLPLDPPLPPLHTLSSSSDDDLPQLDLLELLTFDPEKQQLSCATPLPPFPTSPTHSRPGTPPGTTHISLCSTTLSTESATLVKPQQPKCSDVQPPSATSPSSNSDSQSDIILELSTRLAAASSETAALRKRVASLSVENRQLRSALDDANARLVAVAQAAAATPAANPPVVLGLAQVTADMAKRLGAALVVSDNTNSEDRADRSKKRKRMSGAATTMACFMFMFGAFVATPGLFTSSDATNRTDGNLPAVWTGDQLPSSNTQAVQRVRPQSTRYQPNCIRELKQLTDGREAGDTVAREDADPRDDADNPCVKKEAAADTMFVDMREESTAKVVARSELDRDRVEYSYVLCRDSNAAIANVKSCTSRMRSGEPCGQPHTISLIMPASAAGLEDEVDGSLSPSLAEVQCSIMAVARIPSGAAAAGPHVMPPKYGRVIATMPEKGFMHRV